MRRIDYLNNEDKPQDIPPSITDDIAKDIVREVQKVADVFVGVENTEANREKLKQAIVGAIKVVAENIKNPTVDPAEIQRILDMLGRPPLSSPGHGIDGPFDRGGWGGPWTNDPMHFDPSRLTIYSTTSTDDNFTLSTTVSGSSGSTVIVEDTSLNHYNTFNTSIGYRAPGYTNQLLPTLTREQVGNIIQETLRAMS